MKRSGRVAAGRALTPLRIVVMALVMTGSACSTSSGPIERSDRPAPTLAAPDHTQVTTSAADPGSVAVPGLATTTAPTTTRSDGQRRFEDISGSPPASEFQGPDVDADLIDVGGLNDEGAIACGHAEVAVITFLTVGTTAEVSRAAADAADAATASGIDALISEIPHLRVDIADPVGWETSMVQFLEACQSLGYETL